MNIFIALILLVILAACLYGIFVLAQRVANGVIAVAIGIILILVFLGSAFYLLGGPRYLHG